LSLVPVRALHAAVGIGNEAGELFSLLQKWLWYGKPLDVANAKEELGDLMWYAAQLCNALGFDLGDVMRCNIAKLKARYPEKYTDEKATSRDRDAERRAMEGLNFMAPGFVGEAPVPPIDADNSHRTTPLDPTKPALCQYCPETATCLVEWFKGPAGGKRGPVTVHWCGKCSLKDALAKRGMIAPVREGEDYRVLPLGVAKAEPSSERGTPDGQGLVKGGTVGGE
jgi:NTP pyrophosphatase (non-canonical NTP hydrolase)